MGKGIKIIAVISAAAVLTAAGTALYIKRSAPPGEEWIAYDNDKVIMSIDRQLAGLEIGKIVEEKEGYVVEKGIKEIQKAVGEGLLTYEELTAVCLYRIKTIDQKEKGYNSVVCVNPQAMEEAKRKDLERKKDPELQNSIYGIPIMLKDNINAVGMPCSAGTVAFSGYYPPEDAGLVKALKEKGAIILGKTNLSELSNYVSGIMPAGYSAAKGQTVNPYGPLKLSAYGSSSGSAVAVTANLAPVCIGTETDGSIIAPSAANSVTGFKPSHDVIPGDGIFPLIKKIDTAGPMAKSVEDVAAVYHMFQGEDMPEGFAADALEGKTVGLLGYEYSDRKMMSLLREKLEATGAKVIDADLDTRGIIIFNSIPLSFKKDFEEYAEAGRYPIRKLNELLEYNRKEPGRRMLYGQDLLETAERTGTADMDGINESIQKADDALTALFDEHHLDALVFLNSSGSTAPAAAGYPELTVPFGKDRKGMPQGATFTARKGEDGKLLSMGYSFESHVRGRLVP